MLGTLVGILFALVLAAAVIFIVSRLNLGLTVDSFMTAIIAAAVITIIGGVIAWLLGALGITIGGGFFGALVNLIVAALVLMLGARFVKGMTVNGFTGALVAAIAIGVVTWLANWLLGLFGLA
ncbi:MAG TPA: phage holin family protein [Anaerolineae bacterium]|nr:phage holin family protein [Anaerolineae bacterium]